MLTGETWKAIPGFEGRYEVSDAGRVRSVDHFVRIVRHGVEGRRAVRGRFLRPAPSKSGHLSVVVGKGNTRLVHQLVAEAFIGPRPAGADVAHNDGDPTNNWVANLRYSTRTDNNRDRAHHGTTRLKLAEIDRVRREAPNLPHGGKKRLAASLGVSPSTVSDVLARRTYGHV